MLLYLVLIPYLKVSEELGRKKVAPSMTLYNYPTDKGGIRPCDPCDQAHFAPHRDFRASLTLITSCHTYLAQLCRTFHVDESYYLADRASRSSVNAVHDRASIEFIEDELHFLQSMASCLWIAEVYGEAEDDQDHGKDDVILPSNGLQGNGIDKSIEEYR